MTTPLCRLLLLFLLLGSAIVSACSTGTTNLRQRLDQGRAAYDCGDVLTAYALLSKLEVREEPELAGEYARLLAQVTKATEHLIEHWMERGDYWAKMGDLSRALGFFSDLLTRLPDQDPLRGLLEQRAKPIREKLARLEDRQRKLLRDARRDLKAQRVEQARTLLLEARWHARENNLEFSLDHQRLLAECERRQPGSDAHFYEEVALPMPAERDGSAEQAPRPQRAIRPRPKKAPVKPTEVAAPEEKPADFSPEVEALYRKGEMLLTSGKKVEAIVTFIQVLEKSPDHQAAAEALAGLAAFRKNRIDAWNRSASEHFAKEELEKAAPYYRRILLLDPDNIRAKEGLQMLKRLRELKGRQKKGGS